jgi:hypothetical protein
MNTNNKAVIFIPYIKRWGFFVLCLFSDIKFAENHQISLKQIKISTKRVLNLVSNKFLPKIIGSFKRESNQRQKETAISLNQYLNFTLLRTILITMTWNIM